MKRVRQRAQFKAEAVKASERAWSWVVEVAKRLGMSDKSLYLWVLASQRISQALAVEKTRRSNRRCRGSRQNSKEPMRSVTS